MPLWRGTQLKKAHDNFTFSINLLFDIVEPLQFGKNRYITSGSFRNGLECWLAIVTCLAKREEDGSWRKLHNDELLSLYSSPNIVRMIKSRRMRWAGHVARMGEGRGFTGFWLGSPKARDHWEDLGVGGRIILRWTLGIMYRWGELDSAVSG
jgi:hypothetical protein